MIDVSKSWSAVRSHPEVLSDARVCFFRSSEIVNRPLASVSSVAGLHFQTPEWTPGSLAIGDAYALIPPFTGHGMAMAFQSAVTVVEPYTVKFELKSPSATFLSYLATNPNGCIVPRGVTDLKTKPVGTGPFVFESYEPGQQFVLKANPA